MDASLLKPRTDYLDESSGSGAEGRPRKRFQRIASENDDPRRAGANIPLLRGPVSGVSMDIRNGQAKRRSTIRESKPPLLGPRPLEQGKRVISDSQYQHTQSNNPFLRQPASHSHNDLLYTTSNVASRPKTQDHSASFSRNRSIQESSSSEFLPSVNFDDFHTSISGLNSMSLSAATNASSTTVNSIGGMQRTQPQASQYQPPASNIGRSGSLVRRYSNARKPAVSHQQQNSRDLSSMPPPAAPNTRGRRQSTLTSSLAQAAAPATRQPRKSVGPGYMAPTTSGLRSNSRDARIQPSQSQPSLIRSNSINQSQHPTSLIPNGIQGPNATAARNGRIKSLQPPPRGQSHGNLLYTVSNEQSDIGIGSHVSPRLRTSGRSTPPSSGGNSKRQSTAYVGGLGARTISPTDARRLRRLSQVPQQPDIPQLPSAPPPDLVVARHATQSPAAMMPPKSITPSSSSRNTPDYTRKGHSASSNSSFSSNFRLSNNAGPRTSQILASSRLPTAKPRNLQSAAGFAEEEVPPVPAIPKAYESPKDNSIDTASYFMRHQNHSEDIINKAPPIPTSAPPAPPIEDPRYEHVPNPRHRRGLTVGSGSETEKPSNLGPNLNKKNLQPLRLPPLNLLPLNGSTSNRIASIPTPSRDDDSREASTPPPRRNMTKTPSTPMTASKAQFYHRPSEDDKSELRSSSSHQPVRPNGLHMQDPQFGLSAPIPVPGSRNNASPFASNSLPKLGDFGSFSATPTAATPVDATFQSTPFLLAQEPEDNNMPSPRNIGPPITLPQQSTRTPSSDEPPTPASSSSLRRKLSLTWKRSSSKASQRAQAAAAQADKDEAKAKQNEMPPPKMPASATWTARTSSDAGSIRESFEIKTKKTSGSIPSTSEVRIPSQHSQQASAGSVKAEMANPPAYAEPKRAVPRSASSSLLTPVQRMLGSKGPMSTLRSRNLDTNLDKDDLQADKYMEKLASKRRDFESAAKEVDELRRRAQPKERVSPTQAIGMVNLNIFERGEIVDFKEVYFCGTRTAKKIVGNADQTATNFGYDDERGDYNIVFGDHLSYRYEVVDMLGKGSFGQVVRCIDHKTGGLVAIKIIRNKKRFHQQALVEVNILQKLRDWDPECRHSMINFTQSFYFRGHLCISTELLGINLYEFIKAYDFKGFNLVLIRRFAKQILGSLVLLKSKRVIHCDLKPENILLAHPMHSEIKVIDFGSSCFENEKVYTYIQSRFYRSPEVILGMSYGIPIDMWSLGCILAELLSGYPIFPGENEQEQLACIMEIFGPPEKHLIEKSSRKKLFFDSMGKPRVTVSSKGRRRRPSSKSLQSAIKCEDDAFLDFLTLCLRWDPEKRLKPEQAMQHEFITGVKRVPQASRPIARAPINQSQSTQNSPAKRFNAPNPTPQRAQGTRDLSGTIRPLPEPPALGNRNGPQAGASPIKGGQNPGRRHSTMAPVPGSASIGPQKRVNTASGPGIPAGGGLASVIAGGRQQPQTRAISGRGDLASAAAAVSLRGGAR